MIIDTHCHLASERYGADERRDLLDRAERAGVGAVVTMATSLADVEATLDLAKDRRVAGGLGIHPCEVHEAPDDAVECLRRHAGDSGIGVIGETGLDYFHPAPEGWDEEQFRSRQRRFLSDHFELAAEKGLNIVIHTRDKEGSGSFDDAIGIYAKHAGKVRAVFHCFISEWEKAERVIGMGGLVSFGGIVTFKKADVVKECVRRCPAGTFMLETDAPYLAPEPMRGKRNEPAFTREIAEAIAKLRGESPDEVAAHTGRAAMKFFRGLS